MARGAEPATARALIDTPRLLVIAHRGDSHRAPENTVPAFAAALRTGADLVELDYHHTADGVPVVLHDEHLDRTTNAVTAFGSKKIAVASRSWAEVELLDAGGWFRPEFAGTRLPTLDAALDVIQRGSATLIERKSGDAATCVALLRRKQLLERVVVQSFDWQFLKDCRRQAPKLVLGALGSKELTAEKLDQLSAAGAQIVVWDDKTIGRIEIAAIHGLGLKAWVYTVDDPARAQELIAAGIDGLITNTPAELRALLPDSPSPRQG